MKDDQIREQVITEFSKIDPDFRPHDVDRAHRTGRPYYVDGQSFSSVIVKFTNWYARNRIYEKRKNLPFNVKADLTSRREDLLQYARDQLKNDAEAAKYVEFIFPDRNCKISLKSKDNRIFNFNTTMEFHRTVAFIADSQAPYEAIWRAIEYDRADRGRNLVNLKKRDIAIWLDKAPNNVYIGSEVSTKVGRNAVPASKWNNPFLNSHPGNNPETVLQMYENYIVSTPELFNDLGSLKGKTLGCVCDLDKCYGEVLHKLVGNAVSC